MKNTSVVTVTLSPAIDQTLSIPGFAAGQVNVDELSELMMRTLNTPDKASAAVH